MKKQTEKRLEIKYPCPKAKLKNVEQWIKLSPCFFKKRYQTRKISNIYFDDEALSCLEANYSGQSNRKKIRLRWYNTKEIDEKCFLEIKNKKNSFGYKEIFEINNNQQIKTKQDVVSLIKANIKLKEFLFLSPKTYNFYDRSYFSSFDDEVRITIDKNLYFSRILDNQDITKFKKQNLLDDFFIVEIKFFEKNTELVKSLLKDFPLAQDKFSKYVNCF